MSQCMRLLNIVLLKMGLFFIYFCLSKHTLQFLRQINVKNVHPVYGAGIRTHDLWKHESPPITTRPGLLNIVTDLFQSRSRSKSSIGRRITVQFMPRAVLQSLEPCRARSRGTRTRHLRGGGRARRKLPNFCH